MNGVLALLITVLVAVSAFAQTDSVYTKFDVAPAFEDEVAKNGVHPFVVWLAKRVSITTDKRMGNAKMDLELVIDKLGNISDVSIEGSPSDKATYEIVRVIAYSPLWVAAKVDGQNVNSRVKLKLNFGLSKPDSTFNGKTLVSPTFKGGDINTFRKWVANRLTFPSSYLGVTNNVRVSLSIIIETDGKLTIDEVLLSPHPDFTTKVLQALKSAPRWKPGTADGEPVRFKYKFSVDFVN